MTHLILLTAPRGAGKTTACRGFVEYARAAGLRVGGVLAPAHLDEAGAKVGIDALDAFTGEQRRLAIIEPDETRRTVGPYRFFPAAAEWMLEQVQRALAAPIDVVLIDEIGPLELGRQQGFYPVLESLPQAQATVTILVVRVELLTQLQGLLAEWSPVTITLTRVNRDQIPERLFEEVWGLVSRRWEQGRQG